MKLDPFTALPKTARHIIDMTLGDVLFRQSQPTSGLYRVLSGRVTLRRTTQDGDILTLHRAAPGGYFAEASIFSDVYHCDAICTQAGRVQRLSKPHIIAQMHADPSFAEGFARLLAVQVQQDRALVEILAIRSAKDRVLAAVQAGYLEATIQELATQINLTHEACYRALRVLCDDGRLIKIGRGAYVLPPLP